MSRFKRCLAIINTRSGAREGFTVFASALQQYLDKADAIIICGGDGTMSSVINVLATFPHHPMLQIPIIPLPCGLQNSIATSLGVYSAERSVSAFVMGHVESIPLWEVYINDKLARYIASYISIGAYAMSVQRLHELDAVGENYMALPTVRGKYKLGAFYTAMKNELAPCIATIKTKIKSSTTNINNSYLKIESPIKLFIASQMPLQHRRYTLTPTATFRHKTLNVTYATHNASRLRLWHLLSREAVEGAIMNEDGVGECHDVTELEFSFNDLVNESKNSPQFVMLLDGEPVHLLPGSKVSLRKASCEVLFTTC